MANVTAVDKDPSPTLEEPTEDSTLSPSPQRSASPSCVRCSHWQMATTTESQPPVDWNFYRMFWGLQSYFLNPVKAFDAWETITGNLNGVLNVFKQYPISEEVERVTFLCI